MTQTRVQLRSRGTSDASPHFSEHLLADLRGRARAAHPCPRSVGGSQALKGPDGVWRTHSRGSHYCVIADGWAVSIILTFNAQSVQSSRTPDAPAENSEYMVVVEEELLLGVQKHHGLPHCRLSSSRRPHPSRRRNWGNKVTQPQLLESTKLQADRLEGKGVTLGSGALPWGSHCVYSELGTIWVAQLESKTAKRALA